MRTEFFLYVPQWRSVYLWCLCAVLAVVRTTCPDNALPRVMACTRGLGLPTGTPDNAFVEKGLSEVAKQACRDNKLTEAIRCQEEIISRCQGNSDQEHFLRNMIDLNKQRNFVAFFCSHLDDYEVHAPCIAKMHQNKTQCVAKQRQNMETKVKASENMDFLMTSTCKYFFAAEVCSKTVLSKSCSPAAANVVSRVFSAFKPPVCNTVTYKHQAGDGDLDPQDPSSRAARSRLFLPEVTFCAVLMFVLEVVIQCVVII